jgi:ATP-binding cassette subfamily B protein
VAEENIMKTQQIAFRQFRLLWYFMRGKRLLYVGSVLAMVVATAVALIGPLVLRTTIDSIIGNTPVAERLEWLNRIVEAVGGRSVLARNLWICGSVLVVLALIESIFLFVKSKWSAIAAELTARTIREQLYDHLQSLPYEYHVKAETGDLVQRCTSDVETLRRFLATQFVEVGRAIFMVTTIIPLMAVLDLRMTLVAMVVLPIIFAFAVLFFYKVKTAFLASDEAEGKMTTVLHENVTGVRVVRAFARQVYEIEKFDETNRTYRDVTYRLIRYLAWYWGIASFLGMSQLGIVLVFGTYRASIGAISLGTLVVFITYVQRLIHPIRQMGRILADMGKAAVALGRIQEILDAPLDASEEEWETPEIRGNLEFENVSFEYEPGKPVLKDISFRVEQGQTVAILGPTGSGKTSLMHLLTRLYDYQQGSIKVEGVELKEVDKHWLRKHVGLVLQEPFLFSKTIKENIRLPQKDAQESQIVEAAKLASVHDVIQAFEDGYDTAVGEKGVALSGGQKQRVAIAQTLIKESPVLILDDSLSAVDTETDAAIRKALQQRNHATTFVISHRVTTLSEADMILVLENGKLVQRGSHDELVQEDGLYRRVWEIQNTLEDELEEELEPIT